MRSISLRMGCLVTPHALLRCSVTTPAHATIGLALLASPGRWSGDAGGGRGFPSVESAGYAQPHRRETSALLVPGEPGEHYITPSYLCSAGILFTRVCCRRVYLLMELLYYMSTRYAVGASPATTE